MNTKEAGAKFLLSQDEVRRRLKDNMCLGAYKDGLKWVIPDNTGIIPAKQDIQYFLLQILGYKNNPAIAISRDLCPDANSLGAVVDYLYKRGFTGNCSFNSSTEAIESYMEQVVITPKGLDYLIGYGTYGRLSARVCAPVVVNISPTFGMSVNPTVLAPH